MEDQKYLVEMKNILKNFPGVQALRGVDLNVGYGEIHALVGENGAGKSTLMKCLIGMHPPTSGQIFFEGNELKNYNTSDALKMGIAMIHQELSPVLYRSIMENIWLGREPKTKFGFVDHQKMYDMTKEVLKTINLDVDPKMLMVDLTIAKTQMIEIAKAISYNAKVIIMDEPTSALTKKEIVQLFGIMRQLKADGKSLIYISHKLDEIFEISDKITVFRDGKLIGTDNKDKFDVQSLIKMMVGRDVTEMFPKVDCEIGDIKLQVTGLADTGRFKDVSFTVRKGEILGIAGLVGAGRTEVIETLFGIRKKVSGQVMIDGNEIDIQSPMGAIKNKMALLTEDRRLDGIFPSLTVFQNTIIANLRSYIKKNGPLDNAKALKDVNHFVEAIKIKTPSIFQRVENLSGGNQQKVLVARWLLTEPEILILDEPTRGIDVGAKAEIHRLITALAGQGKSIIMVSSELPEVMGMSDRIMIMHEGKVTGIIDNRKDLTQEEIMTYATGNSSVNQAKM